MPCRITIYTATGARHPVEAKTYRKTGGDWEGGATALVNDVLIGTLGTTTGEHVKFEFECPAPQQYWEIHIQTPEFSPFPNFLDRMIGSCENRGFVITYPGGISRAPFPPQSAEEVLACYVAKPVATAAP
jgi:hypothetical protein